MTKLNPSPYFKNLDGLRTICFLMVFIFHSFTTENSAILKSDTYHFLKNSLFGNGNLGVNFFFVLSGFLITYLLLVEDQTQGRIHVVKFWLRRILRIWPLYFLCVLIGFVAFPMIKHFLGETPQETAHFWRYALFISNLDFIQFGRPDASVLGVLWSVAIEEQFYLIWPLLFLAFPKRYLWLPMLLILGASLVYRIFNPDYMHYEFHTFSCMNDLVLGGLIGWWCKTKEKQLSWFISNCKWILYFAYAGFILLFFFRDEIFYGSLHLKPFEKLCSSIFIGLIILDQAFNSNSPFQLSRLKLISKLGKYTYGMYCLQFVAILITVTIFKKILGFDNIVTVYFVEPIISLVLNVILAIISYKYFESYFLKLKSKFA